MENGEIVVNGGEPGRLTAYFDANNELQIFGGGALSGAIITLLQIQWYQVMLLVRPLLV